MFLKSSRALFLATLLSISPSNVLAQHSSNGMDPSMDMPMNLASGRMVPYLHFTPGDILWLEGWVPGRSSTLFGACVGLFVLALLHRWVIALRAALEFSIAMTKCVFPSYWMVRANDSFFFSRSHQSSSGREQKSLLDRMMFRGAAPFVLQHALSRGILHMIQVSIGFLFMLAVMYASLSLLPSPDADI